MRLYYNPERKAKASKLRKNSTLSEVLLWNHLKRKQMMGFDFHRQKPVGDYIVDFLCSRLMLAIEIDGSSHDYKGEKDAYREKKLRDLGLTVLRFEDRDIKQNLESVLITIQNWIIRTTSEHTPSLLRPSESDGKSNQTGASQSHPS